MGGGFESDEGLEIGDFGCIDSIGRISEFNFDRLGWLCGGQGVLLC